MIEYINKSDIAILFFLLGLLLGMGSSVFLKYTVKVDAMNSALHDSCHFSTQESVSLSLFGTVIAVECADGKVIKFNSYKTLEKLKSSPASSAPIVP